ncbi:MarR family winged helix-turn-helix transcriptional regulator [Zavarzinia compransoris]|uniref:HTH marR-type domain-containing protein n=1 Tax=Zavarzinia compransoris TaxID=1264899 RepID=A0A317DUP3_9PROT|nr:MarR family transcriptional regulator [Zavarzinia compransoris]PWR18361.1 hypothetical protein DKG75_20575 [Zavarzinia compransoris]
MAEEANAALGELIPYLARLLNKELSDALRPLGLSPAQYDVLEFIWSEGATSPKIVIERRAVEPSSVSGTLSRLERDGFVTRIPDPDDRRSLLVKPTERAIALEAPARAAVLAVLTKVTQGWADRSVDLFIRAVRRAIQQLERP